MFGTEKVSPELLLGLGSGLLSGRTWNEQVANAGTGALTAVNANKEKQARDLQLRSTADFLRDKDPQLAAMVQNGSIQPADAYKQYLTSAQEKAKASQPDYLSVDGMIFDKTSKEWIAPPSDMKTTKPTPDYQDYLLRKNDPEYGKFKQSEVDMKNAPSTKDNFESEQTLWKNWRSDADVKEYQGVRNGFEKIRVSAVDPTGPKDLGIIFGYMKMLDPTSVVRENEQASVANAGGVPQQIISLYNRVLTGEKLPEQVRTDIIKAAEGLYTESAQNYETVNKQVRDMAARYNVDPQFITPVEKYEPLKIGEKVETTVNGKKATIERVSE